METYISKTSVVKNYYYLIAGIVSVVSSFTHTQNGRATVFPAVDNSALDQSTKTTVHYVWHIIAVENLTVGATLITMAFHTRPSKVRFAAWLIALMMVSRWGVLFRSALLKNMNASKDTLPDLMVIMIYVGLILLGIRRKDELQE